MNLQLLSASFNLPLEQGEVGLWQRSWVQMMQDSEGKDFSEFMTTKTDSPYPLLQYRVGFKQATIVALNAATTIIQRSLSAENQTINWKGEPFRLELERLQLETFELHSPATPLAYRILHYLPFDEAALVEYNAAGDLAAKIILVGRALEDHFAECCTSLGFVLPQKINVTLTQLDRTQLIEFREGFRPAFGLHFTANVFLPSGISLGHAAERGYGLLLKPSNNTYRR